MLNFCHKIQIIENGFQSKLITEVERLTKITIKLHLVLHLYHR